MYKKNSPTSDDLDIGLSGNIRSGLCIKEISASLLTIFPFSTHFLVAELCPVLTAPVNAVPTLFATVRARPDGTGLDAFGRSQTGPDQRWRVRWGPGVIMERRNVSPRHDTSGAEHRHGAGYGMLETYNHRFWCVYRHCLQFQKWCEISKWWCLLGT